MEGKFIVIEGLDGSGKTTQIRALSQRLRDMGRSVAETAEPTASATGGLIRDALSGLTPRTGAEIAALFMADRIAHNVHPVSGINVLLAQGRDVICDRYYYSSLAYQGVVSDPDWVFHINVDCPEIRRPDLCVFLDLDDEACLRRMEAGRAYREIYENENTLLAVRRRYFEAFERLKDRDRIVLVNADRTPGEVAEDVFAAVRAVLEE
ncbi:MAG: dTMP kinase [Oscillospiraceae bacterium]|nr:dTMP kinase [Oscillospiraceae bacterium]MBR7190242.1 dTMP kinase [Oscillospiraceae bacterium]